MSTLQLMPIDAFLRQEEGGTVRVGASRVTLDTLVGCYLDGNTAEEIVQQFPSMALADVHAAISFYLSHRVEVEAYLARRATEAGELRSQVDQVSDQRGIRERLLARQASRKSAS